MRDYDGLAKEILTKLNNGEVESLTGCLRINLNQASEESPDIVILKSGYSGKYLVSSVAYRDQDFLYVGPKIFSSVNEFGKKIIIPFVSHKTISYDNQFEIIGIFRLV